MTQEHRQQLAPVLVAMLRSSEEACPAGRASAAPGPSTEHIPAAVLAKEAVYNAVGTCSYDLHDFLDLRSWLRNALAAVCAALWRARSCAGCAMSSIARCLCFEGNASRCKADQ